MINRRYSSFAQRLEPSEKRSARRWMRVFSRRWSSNTDGVGALTNGLRNRLFLIALVPLVAIAATTARDTASRSGDLRTASEVVTLVDRLTETLTVGVAISAERLPTQAREGAERFGVSSSIIALLIGFDPEVRIREARPVTDAAISADRFYKVRDQLASLRRRADGGATIEEVNDTWNNLGAELGTIQRRDLAKLELAISRTHHLERELATLLASETLANAFSDETTTLFELRSNSSEQRKLRRILAVSRDRVSAANKTLRTSGGPRTKAIVTMMDTDPSVLRSTAQIEDVLRSPTRPMTNDLAGTAAAFTALLRRGEYGNRVSIEAAAEMREQASQQRAAAERSLALSTALAVSIVVASLAAAVLAARSIVRPLQMLAARAKGVAAGRLENEPLDEKGPAEVVLVTRAFNDLVSNLEILDQQVVALAEGNVDAVALQQSLPGGLGTSIRKTVDLLSHSVRSRDEMEERLAHEASHDPLTGLSNRQAVMRAMEAALRRAHRTGGSVSCLFIDLDGFKLANDYYGHRFGDDILKLCAERLSSLDSWILELGRLGGDEFIIVTEDFADAQDPIAIARCVVDLLSDPFYLDGRVCQIGASVGVALSTGDATASSIIRDADMAVYRAKQRGGGAVEVFDAALSAEMEHRADIDAAFQHALANDQLWVAYQPIVEQAPGEVARLVSLEALIRWDRPGFGPISPADFVPLLEKGPRIIDLTRYVLRRSLQEISHLRTMPGLDSLSVSVNFSVRDLSLDGLVHEVIRAVADAGIPPASLTIEITETALLTDVAIATEHLRQLREAGFRIALDDFGTGFTSISQLAVLPVDIMKIDRSFTRLVTDPDKRAIVEMMIGVARTLGLIVVAEGVETLEESAALNAMGCLRQQGWLHGRPQAPDSLFQLVAHP